MRKTDIARRIRQQGGISKKEAATLFDGILELLKATLQKGEPITIPGFGKFMVRNKLSRPGRNPRTREAIMIAARRVVSFRASSFLTAEMNPVQAANPEAVTSTE